MRFPSRFTFTATDLDRPSTKVELGFMRLMEYLPLRHRYAREKAQRGLFYFYVSRRSAHFDMRELADHCGLFEGAHRNCDDYTLIELFTRAIQDGKIVCVRVQPWTSVTSKEDVGKHQELIKAIERESKNRLLLSGREYKLSMDVGRTDPGNAYEVVAQDEAKRILEAMASKSYPSTPLAKLLTQARDQLSRDFHPTSHPDGLILLSRLPVRRAPAVPIAEPAITPSQMKALLEKTEEKTDDEPTIRLVNVEAPNFVPGVETLLISYAIDGPVAKTASVVMTVESVPIQGDRSVVENLAVPGPYAASGKVDWDGKAANQGGFITLKGSPYEVTFELTSKSGKKSKSGPGKIRVEVKEVKITVDDTGPLKVNDPWQATVTALIAELKKSGMPGNCEGRVIIDSPLFKVNSPEMYDGTSYLEYQRLVGFGPPIPLLASILLKSKSGTGKRSAPVLLGTRLLWDFKLESSADLDGSLGGRGMHPAAKTFVKKAAAFEENVTLPKGASAHFYVGGFRAKAGDFAPIGGEWTMGGKWALVEPTQRQWAAFTACGGEIDDKADSAIYFSPGRMAGDVHQVRAFVDVDEKLDVKDEKAPDGIPAAQKSNSVKLTVWRRIAIVANWIVGAGTTPVSIPPLTAEYKKAALLIEAAKGVGPQDIGAQWTAAYKSAADEYVQENEPFLSKALETDPQGYPVRFRDYMDYWERSNPDAGFFGELWERIRNFFGANDEDEYKKKCGDIWYRIFKEIVKKVSIPGKGITAIKFGYNGPHNQNPDPESFTAGVAPSIKRVTNRGKALFFQFTVSDNSETFIHEVGHTLFLAHAPGHFKPGEQPGGVEPDAHDKHQTCLMSYSPRKANLCGLCYLKLAGWNYRKVGADGTIKP